MTVPELLKLFNNEIEYKIKIIRMERFKAVKKCNRYLQSYYNLEIKTLRNSVKIIKNIMSKKHKFKWKENNNEKRF